MVEASHKRSVLNAEQFQSFSTMTTTRLIAIPTDKAEKAMVVVSQQLFLHVISRYFGAFALFLSCLHVTSDKVE